MDNNLKKVEDVPVDESPKEQPKEPYIKDFGFSSHMNMDKCGIRLDAGDIVWHFNPIHGKKLVRQVYTPKKGGVWGKGEVTFFLNEKDSPEFKTLKEFFDNYKNNS